MMVNERNGKCDVCFQVECANGQLGFGRRRRRDVASDGADVEQQRLYEVSMSTIIRFDEDESPLRAVTKREQVPSARQRQHLLVEKGIQCSSSEHHPRHIA